MAVIIHFWGPIKCLDMLNSLSPINPNQPWLRWAVGGVGGYYLISFQTSMKSLRSDWMPHGNIRCPSCLIVLTHYISHRALRSARRSMEKPIAPAYPDVATASWPLGTSTGVEWERQKCPCWCCWWVRWSVSPCFHLAATLLCGVTRFADLSASGNRKNHIQIAPQCGSP